MEIVIKTILRQSITQCTGTQDIIKKLVSCDPCERKSGLKTVAFLLRLSIYFVNAKRRQNNAKLDVFDFILCLYCKHDQDPQNHSIFTHCCGI